MAAMLEPVLIGRIGHLAVERKVGTELHLRAAAIGGSVSVAADGDSVIGSRDLSEFYASAYPKLVGALSLYCGDRDVAGDLAQEAMARVCRDWVKVSRLDSPEAWGYRVGINLANSWLRRNLTRRRAVARVGGATVVDDDVATVVAVRRAVSGLPRRQRSAVVLRYFSDLSVAQTAAVMRCAEGTVRALTSQALERLRETSLVEISEVSS